MSSTTEPLSMSHKLIDRNQDLERLRHDGYSIEVRGGYLILRGVPYVNEKRQVRYDGILAAALNLNGDLVNPPSTHTIKFVGEFPCQSNGAPIEGIRHSSGVMPICDGLTAQHSFSSKPPRGRYLDYHEQFTTYAAILSGPATNLDPNATPRTYQVVEPQEEDSPFHYIDTASARAEINATSNKLACEKVAIVGLGGTGSYVLDLVTKTPVREVHLFDADIFSSHNAFRAPGAASKDDLHKQPSKVNYLATIYSRMHRRIIPHEVAVDASNAESLCEMSFVFLCMDGGSAKRAIVDTLDKRGIAFIDVGMGLYTHDNTLGGKLRVTLSTAESRVFAQQEIAFSSGDGSDEYDKNIQIADLNALNAALAVIRWKKYRGFYFDLEREWGSTYTIGSNLLINEGSDDPDRGT